VDFAWTFPRFPVKKNVTESQEKQKKQYAKKRKVDSKSDKIKKGDKVLLFNARKSSRKGSKMEKSWKGHSLLLFKSIDGCSIPENGLPNMTEKGVCLVVLWTIVRYDQGREFVNSVMSSLIEKTNAVHRISTAYHPQTNDSLLLFKSIVCDGCSTPENGLPNMTEKGVCLVVLYKCYRITGKTEKTICKEKKS
jgi:hypothetical protein